MNKSSFNLSCSCAAGAGGSSSDMGGKVSAVYYYEPTIPLGGHELTENNGGTKCSITFLIKAPIYRYKGSPGVSSITGLLSLPCLPLSASPLSPQGQSFILEKG